MIGFRRLRRVCNTTRRSLSTTIVRDYIRDVLYNPSEGYFMQDVIYSRIKEEKTYVDFNELAGEAEYRLMLRDMYEKRGVAWMTPCEIFAPWYSFAIARYLLKEHRRTNESTLRVVEIGGGNGTNMMHMLDFLKSQAPDVYANTRATLVDISPAMSERQAEIVESKHPGRCRFINDDICDPKPNGELGVEEEPCFVVGLEILDNLPHDKVFRNGDDEIEEVHVVSARSPDGQPCETRRPLSDSWIQETLKHFPIPDSEMMARYTRRRDGFFGGMWKRVSGSRARGDVGAFVPTGAVRLLHVLNDRFPSHRLILADFDHLPAPNVPLVRLPSSSETFRDGTLDGPIYNTPLVAAVTPNGKDVDYETYLLPHHAGTADIFFATDFDRLSDAYTRISKGRHATVHRSSEFLIDHADCERTVTTGGYNPLLEDFTNTRFILT